MAEVARISRVERNKPLLCALLCLGFAVWFAVDGWYNWPAADNTIVHRVVTDENVSTHDRNLLKSWPGWNHATALQRSMADRVVHANNFSGWRSTMDIAIQKIIVVALLACAAAAIAWYMRVRKRRVEASEAGFSPRAGVLVPWDKITTIDNTRWPKAGIVDVAYQDAQNQPCTARLDDYVYDNLRPVLTAIAAHATNAAMVPPVATPSAAADQ